MWWPSEFVAQPSSSACGSSPSRLAADSVASTSAPAPSASTKPARSPLNGRLAWPGSSSDRSPGLRPRSAFIVANPLTTAGVNALSPAPQRARSASPDRRNIAPRTTACPPEAHAFAGAALGPYRPEVLRDLAGGLIDDHPRNQIGARGQASPLAHPVLLGARADRARRTPSQPPPPPDADRSTLPCRSRPESANASRAAAIDRCRNRAESFAIAGSSVVGTRPEPLDHPPQILEELLAAQRGVPPDPRSTLDQPLPGRVHVAAQTGHRGVSDYEDPLRHPRLPLPDLSHTSPRSRPRAQPNRQNRQLHHLRHPRSIPLEPFPLTRPLTVAPFSTKGNSHRVTNSPSCIRPPCRRNTMQLIKFTADDTPSPSVGLLNGDAVIPIGSGHQCLTELLHARDRLAADRESPQGLRAALIRSSRFKCWHLSTLRRFGVRE